MLLAMFLIFSISLFEAPDFGGKRSALITLTLVLVFIIIEWIGRDSQYAIENIGKKWKRPLRITFYYALIIAIFWFGGKEQQFIYFQF